jgi:hypothetical protein
LYIEAAACPLRLSVWEKDTTPCYHLVCFRSRFSKSESATTVHIKIKAAACVLSEIVLESEVYSVWWYLSCSTNHGNLGCCPPFADSVVMMFSIIEFEAEATIHPLHASSRSRSKSTRQPALINTTPSQFCWFPSDWSPRQVVCDWLKSLANITYPSNGRFLLAENQFDGEIVTRTRRSSHKTSGLFA